MEEHTWKVTRTWYVRASTPGKAIEKSKPGIHNEVDAKRLTREEERNNHLLR